MPCSARPMSAIAFLSAVAVLTCLSAPAAAQTTRSGPNPPGGRLVSKPEDCEALRKEWEDYKAAWTVQHQACLDSHNRDNTPSRGSCSKAACQQLHYLVFEYASTESERAMSQCRAILDTIAKEKARIAEENARLAREQAEREAAVRRYNEQVAEYNRQLLQAITAQNASIAEQNRLAAEAVAQRNREAQAAFRDLVREYQLKVDVERQPNASLQQMREFLATARSALSQRVSNLVDELGAATFSDAVDSLQTSTGTLSDVFDVTSALTDIDPPERVTATTEFVDKFASLYKILKAGATNLSNTSTPTERFSDTISGLSGSTTFAFRGQPGVGALVSDNIESIGRWGNTLHQILDETFSGRPPTTEEIRERLGRALFPRFMDANDKLTHIEGTADKVYQWFGGGNASR